jgi:hypothetical protein
MEYWNAMDTHHYGGGLTKKQKIIIGAVTGIALIVIVIVIVIAVGVSSQSKPSAPVAAEPARPAPVAAPAPAPVAVPAPAPVPVPAPAPVPVPAPIVNRQLTGCESDSASLKCDSGMIKGGSIRYGRWNNSICPHPTVNASTSPREKTYQMTPGCLNTPSCTLGNYNSTLQEDIYPNVYKHWEINYQCQ